MFKVIFKQSLYRIQLPVSFLHSVPPVQAVAAKQSKVIQTSEHPKPSASCGVLSGR